MPSELQVAVVLNEFAVPSPGQQLLDRFLIGYSHDGVFQPPARRVALYASNHETASDLAARGKDLGLKSANLTDAGLSSETRVIFAGRDAVENETLVRQVLPKLPQGARCFVYGPLAHQANLALELLEMAEGRGIFLAAGSAAGTAFRLPEFTLPSDTAAPPFEVARPVGTAFHKALIVTHGAFPEAELDGLEGLASVSGERGAAGRLLGNVEGLKGQRLWDIAYSGEWRMLLAAAVSRSDNIQGDALKDGRTQDAVGMQILEKLAPAARGWLLKHGDGSESLHLVLNGAVHDMNFAMRLAGGKVLSAQLYRPPPPAQEHFSQLTARIAEFFAKPPAETDRAHILYVTTCLERMRGIEATSWLESLLDTPAGK